MLRPALLLLLAALVMCTVAEASEAGPTFSADFSCLGRSQGLYADPTRCRVFHKCTQEGEKKIFVCRVGNVFDGRSRRCLPSQEGCPTNPFATTDQGRRRGRVRGGKRYMDTVTPNSLSFTGENLNRAVQPRRGRVKSIDSSRNVQQSRDSDVAQSLTKEVAIKPRDQYRRMIKQPSQRINNYSPIVDVAREPSLLSEFFHSSVGIVKEPDVESSHNRRYVIGGVLPPYKNQLNGEASRDDGNRGRRLRIQVVSGPSRLMRNRQNNNRAINRFGIFNCNTVHTNTGIDTSGIFESKRMRKNKGTNSSAIFGSSGENNNAGSNPSGIFESSEVKNNAGSNPSGLFGSSEVSNNAGSNPSGIFESSKVNNNARSNPSGIFGSSEVNNNTGPNPLGIFESSEVNNNAGANPSGIFESSEVNNNAGSNPSGIFENSGENNNVRFSPTGIFVSGQVHTNSGRDPSGTFEGSRANDNAGSTPSGIFESSGGINNVRFSPTGIFVSGRDTDQSDFFGSGQENSNTDTDQSGLFESGQQNSNTNTDQSGLFESGQQNSNTDTNLSELFVRGQQNGNIDTDQSGLFGNGQQNSNTDTDQSGLFGSGQQNSNTDTDPSALFGNDQQNSNTDTDQSGLFGSGQQNSNTDTDPSALFGNDQQNSNTDTDQSGLFGSGQQNSSTDTDPSALFGNGQQNSNTDTKQSDLLGNGQKNNTDTDLSALFESGQQNDNGDSKQTSIQDEDQDTILDNLDTNLESIFGDSGDGKMDIDVESLFNSLQENTVVSQDGASSTTENTATDELFSSWNDTSSGGDDTGINTQFNNMQGNTVSQGGVGSTTNNAGTDELFSSWNDTSSGGDDTVSNTQFNNMQGNSVSQGGVSSTTNNAGTDELFSSWNDTSSGGDDTGINTQFNNMQGSTVGQGGVSSTTYNAGTDELFSSWNDTSSGGDDTGINTQFNTGINTQFNNMQGNTIGQGGVSSTTNNAGTDELFSSWNDTSSGGDDTVSNTQFNNMQGNTASQGGVSSTTNNAGTDELFSSWNDTSSVAGGIGSNTLFNSMQGNTVGKGVVSSTTNNAGTDGLFSSWNDTSSGGGGFGSNTQFNGFNNFTFPELKNQLPFGYNYGPVIKEYKEQVTVTTRYLLGNPSTDNPGGITFINQFMVNQTEIPPTSFNPNKAFSQSFNRSFIAPNGNQRNDGSIHPDFYYRGDSDGRGIGNTRPAGNTPNYNTFQGYQQNGLNNQYAASRGQQTPNFGGAFVPINEQSFPQNTGPPYSSIRGHFITEAPPAGVFGTTQSVQSTRIAPELPLRNPYHYQLPFNPLHLPQKPMFENSHVSVPVFPPPNIFYSIDPRIGPPIGTDNSQLTSNSAQSDEKANVQQTNTLPRPSDYETVVQDSIAGSIADREESKDNDGSNINLPSISASDNAYQGKGMNSNSFTPKFSSPTATPFSRPDFPTTVSPFSVANENPFTNPAHYLPPPAYNNVHLSKTNAGAPFRSGNSENNYFPNHNVLRVAVTPPSTFISTTLPFFGHPQLYTTITPGQYITQTTLTPQDVFRINGLQPSASSPVTGIVNQVEVVRSVSFALDSEEGRRQLEAARSKGVWR